MLRPTLALIAGSVLAAGLIAQTPPPPSAAPAAPAKKLEFPKGSPAASFKTRFGITDVEVNYARPSVRNRKIFGGLVPYDKVWRTGADAPTKITFSTPVKFGGKDVDAGTYGLFTIPGQNEWTVILNKIAPRDWGSYGYKQADDVTRVTVKPVPTGSLVETFQISVDDLRNDSATLNLAWENVRVPVKLEADVKGMLEPQIRDALANAERKPYFDAAMFYYDQNIDLKQAADWMASAVAQNPNAFWASYRHGLILAKLGDKEGARAAATKSLEAASKHENAELREEYTRLNNALLDSLK